MRLPNKITSYSESVLSKFCAILNIISKSDISIYELYNLITDNFDSVIEYIDVLDCLFALNKIEFNENTGEIHYVVWSILWRVSSKKNYI